MCGRFTQEFTWRQVHDFLSLQFPPGPDSITELPPSYNVAPTQTVAVCKVGDRGERELAAMKWGFIPGWSDEAKILINARSETVATSPAFRAAFKSRRCVVPASAFYEWRVLGGKKQPVCFRALNDPIFALAALWEPSREHGACFTVLTTEPNELVAKVHDRMPVMLKGEQVSQWMDAETPGPELMKAFPAEEMESYDVSARVNSPKNNDPTLAQRLGPQTLFG
ncbi:MAG: SOS response-associated peptidase [Phycisphaerales bacterium]